MCPLQEDILTNLKVFKFQQYNWVSRKFRDQRKISLKIFQKCIFTYLWRLFQYQFLNWLFEGPWNSNDSLWWDECTVTQWQKVHCQCPEHKLITLLITSGLHLLWYNLGRCTFQVKASWWGYGLQNGDLTGKGAGNFKHYLP